MKIQGPAIIKRGGVSIYFRDGLNVEISTETADTPSDIFGDLGPVLKSRITKISGRPTGMITDDIVSALLPYSPGGVGASIFGNSNTPLEIWSKTQGQKITWARSGLSTATTTLKLSATDTFWGGNIEFTCLGKPDEASTAANHWQTIASQAFSDDTFDDSAIRRYRYTAAFGGSPYAAMTAQDGFQVDIACKFETMNDDNVGVADIILSGVTAMAKFKPSNLTEAQIATLIRLQDTGAIDPGDWIGSSATDLVISGSNAAGGVTVTLHKAGFQNAALVYAVGKYRAGEVAAATRLSWTDGSLNDLFTVEVTTV